MRVKTNIKAGVDQSLSQQAGRAAENVTGFFGKATQQAQGLAAGTAKTTSTLYSCLAQSFRSK